MAQWKPPAYAIPYEQPEEQRWTPPPYAKPLDPEAVEHKWVPPPYASRPEIDPPLDFDLPAPQDSFEARQPLPPDSLLKKFYNNVKSRIPDVEARKFIEPGKEPGILQKAWDIGNKGVLDYLPENAQKYRPKELYKSATEGLRKFGESQTGEDSFTNRVKQVARYGQAFGEAFAGGAEEMLNPINVGLAATTFGSGLAFKGALAAKDVNKAQKLYRIGKSLETPERVAAIGMVGHGGYKAVTADTVDEKTAGFFESALGAFGVRSKFKPKFSGDPTTSGSKPTGPTPQPVISNSSSSPIPGPAPVVPPTKPVTPPAQTSIAKLAHDLQGAKPRFNIGVTGYQPKFENDIDKALFIIAQSNPSKRNAEYLKFVMDNTGLDEVQAVREGRKIKDLVKNQVTGKQGGSVNIPTLWAPPPPTPTISPAPIALIPPVDPNLNQGQPEPIPAPIPESAPVPESIIPPPVKPGNEFDPNNIDLIRQYVQDLEAGNIPPKTTLPDYFASKAATPIPEPVNESIITTPDKPISFDEILPPQPNEVMLPDVRQPIQGRTADEIEIEAEMRGSIPQQTPPPTRYEINELESGNLGVVDTIGGKTLMETNNPAEAEAFIQTLPEPDIIEGQLATAQLPDVRQVTPEQPGQLEQIGQSARRSSDNWEDYMHQLDAEKAPDIKYRDILSTGTRNKLKKGETWRGKVQEYIRMDRELGAQIEAEKNAAQLPEVRSQVPEQSDQIASQLLKVQQEFGRNSDEYRAAELQLRPPESAQLPDVRQAPESTGQLEQIGRQIEGEEGDYVRPEGIRSKSDDWEDGVAELDSTKASDGEYKYLLTPLNKKKPLKKNETWRDRVQKQIKTARADEGLSEWDKGEQFQKIKPKKLTGEEYIAQQESLINRETDPIRAKATYDSLAREYENVKPTGDDDKIQTLEDLKNIAKTRLDELTSSSREPQFMKVPGKPKPGEMNNIAMGGADPPVLDALGTALYGKEPPAVIAKELIQNGDDEHQIAGIDKPLKVVLGYGDNHPITGEEARSITVRDYGRGMTPDDLYTKFTDLGKSGKRGEEKAAGGFGFAKAAPMLAGTYVRVTTVVKEKNQKVSYSFEGDPTQMKDQVKGVPLVRKGVNLPLGTQVTTWFPKTQGLSLARDLIKNIALNTPKMKSGIIVADNYIGAIDPHEANDFLNDTVKPDNDLAENYTELHKPQKQAALQDTITPEGANVDIKFDPPGPEVENQRYTLHVLNKGLYQFSVPYGHYGRKALPNAPENITVDVMSTVEEGKDHYPFTLNREALSDEVLASVRTWIDKNIISGAQEKMKAALQKSYDDLQPVLVSNVDLVRPSILMDQGNRLKPEELIVFRDSPTVHQLNTVTDKLMDTILQRVNQPKWNERLEKTGTLLRDGVLGIHVPNPDANYAQSAIAINHMLHIQSQPDPKKAALAMVVTGLHEAGHLDMEGRSIVYNSQISPEEMNDPRIGEFIQELLKEQQEQGGLNDGHDVEFVKRLGEVFTTMGPQATFGAADEFYAAITDPLTGGYSGEVQKLLQIYQKSRGRAATEEDILGATGIHQDAPSGRKKNNGSATKPDGNGATGKSATDPKKSVPIDQRPKVYEDAMPSIGKLRRAIEKGELQRHEQDVLGSEEMSRRVANIESVTDEGIEGYYQQLGYLKGALPKVSVNSELNDEDIQNYFKVIHNSHLMPLDKISAKTGMNKLLAGMAPQPSEIKFIKQVFGGDLGDLTMLQGGLGLSEIRNFVNNAVSVPKTLMSTLDVSLPFRQGLPFVYKKQFWSAFAQMFKYYGSQKAFDALDEAIQDRPRYELGKQSGLFKATTDDVLETREDAFQSTWVGQIPIFGRAHRASERAAIGFANKLRVDVFDDLADRAEKLGLNLTNKRMIPGRKGQPDTEVEVPTEFSRALAKFVNTASGRGHLRSLEKAAVELNALLFSPRLLSSRITMLNPWYYVDPKIPSFVRKQALKSLFAAASAGGTIAYLLKENGFDVGVDPSSSDFGKVKIGNIRIDMYGGFQQPVVAAYRLMSGKSTTTGGKTTDIYKSKFPNPTAQTVIGNFARSKESPWVSFIDTMAQGAQARPPGGLGREVGALSEKFTGSKMHRAGPEIINRFSPMIASDVIDIAREDPDLLPLSVLASIGMGVNTFDEAKKAPQRPPSMRMRLPMPTNKSR